jgi:SAM-dependent methyltransferase
MTVEKRYKKRYKSGDTPWDAGKPDFNLIETVTDHNILSCKTLDVGCGTGDNSIWLAQNGFQVTGTDVSEIALEKAKEKAFKAGIECEFLLADFLNDKVKAAPFGFIFDRGCFHSYGSKGDRERFAKNVAADLEIDGLWLTIVGNADEDRQGPGPPQRRAKDIVLAVEPYFEILLLQSTHFGSKSSNAPRAWKCLMRKREEHLQTLYPQGHRL